jgi:hypothetical protein
MTSVIAEPGHSGVGLLHVEELAHQAQELVEAIVMDPVTGTLPRISRVGQLMRAQIDFISSMLKR